MPKATSSANSHFESLFTWAPISLWEEDYRGIKQFLDELRSRNESIEKTLMRADGAMYQEKLLHHAKRK